MVRGLDYYTGIIFEAVVKGTQINFLVNFDFNNKIFIRHIKCVTRKSSGWWSLR
jgi:ATP phosphoribosyltransferase regulatory subunit HisZ